MRTALCLFALVSLGCAGGPGSEPIGVDADFEEFVVSVQPILQERCANPSCHGQISRPFEVFAVHQYRADPAMTFSDEPLSDDELWWNYQRARAFTGGAQASQAPLVSKPLAPEAGGAKHVGGVVWEGTGEPEYAVVVGWIEGSNAEVTPP